MFMDINENQKQVSKSLKNTLLVDLLWDSDDPKEKRTALNIRIAEGLGTIHQSPLYNRVIIGEETQTETRIITTENIKNGLLAGDYLNKYKNNGTVSVSGIFDYDNNDTSYEKITEFIMKCLETVISKNKEEWEKGSEGFLSLNNTVYGLIRIFSDIVKIKQQGLAGDDIFDKCKPMVEHLADAITGLNDDEKHDIKKSYGGGGKNMAYRVLQIALNKADSEYTNADLKAYLESISTENNEKVAPYIEPLKEHFRKAFSKKYTESDLIKSFPTAYQALNNLVVQKKIANSQLDINEPIEPWSVAEFDTFLLIAKEEKADTLIEFITDGEGGTTKKEIYNWFVLLKNIEQSLKDEKPVNKQDYELIEGLYKSFVDSGQDSD